MKLNKAGMTGFFMCFLAILFGISTNGGIQTVINYLHIPSFILTVGGALCAVLATADSFEDFWNGLKGIGIAFERKGNHLEEISELILDLSDIARREGLLSLEEKADSLTHPLLKKGINLIVDGTEPELARDILETEMDHKEENERKRVKFWEDFGAYAPAWGMIGTLIGLINMMKTMGTDATSIGSGMSLALITTLYGSVIANWLCIPIARKLDKNCAAEHLEMELVIEGVLSIQAGENSRIIKEKLKAILKEGALERLDNATKETTAA
ncbi:MAG: MotA/TolQ/ExbB proton channel family protein [Roseburia sp.]|uniref:motility protein A n=1 Tax=Roseburia sp. 831b TaxID=1261635 RepID=UPI000952E8F0|nr:MotA/TolQ/ExbB proton channel family protein [Roseburia sp. 831b]MCI5918826.1 MotA/TolQ/ExbB proton channel family protein [Roseburia sp.]MDD6216306.1 MotA/TolQ/ExbB proton channel family protein [Roseburia sp.]MDY5884647.1 MotA/TolQ/ExbB proton channel family protein [Roseburia sp.]WVK72203.1 MotA/TolQ/ExbB proton channel family protein [Roseburia sp. 831b]